MLIYISATQILSYLGCVRKWYGEYVDKLPVLKGPQFPEGTVFHAAAARYLKGDETGRDEEGNPVELFPDDWLITEEGVVANDRGEMIKKMINLGIEEGIFEKLPGRRIEERHEINIIEGVKLIGYIDALYPRENMVVDHKTTSNFRYALSAKALAADMQMLIYGCFYLHHLVKTEPEKELPLNITLRHNQFLKHKTKPKAKYTAVNVPTEEFEEVWKKCENIAEEMKKWYQWEYTRWFDIPEAREKDKTCNKYGGCPFQYICGMKESKKQYVARVNKVLERKGSEMGLLNNMKKKAADKKEAPKEETIEVSKTPPWANPECVACEGEGVNSKGNPCRICDDVARSSGKKTSDKYILNEDQGGWVEITSTEAKEEKSLDTVYPGTLKSKGLAKATESKQKKGRGRPPKKKEEAPKEEEEEVRGRPPQGVTLYIGCTPTKFGSRKITLFDDLYKELQEVVTKEFEVESYYLADPFKRRDLLAVTLEAAMVDMNSINIVVPPIGSLGPDPKAAYEVLRANATTIIESIS